MPLFAQRCWEFSKLPIGKCLDAFQLGDQHVRVADDVGRQIAREGVEDLGRYPIGEPEHLVERMRLRIEIVTDDDVSPGTAGGDRVFPRRDDVNCLRLVGHRYSDQDERKLKGE